jgi:Spy/CpxP family protein refolding chaperone
LAALVIFAAGVVTGSLTVRLKPHEVAPPSTPAPTGMAPFRQRGDLLDRMQRQLYLDPTQRQHIEVILRDNHERMKQIWDSIAPQAQQEHRKVRELIRAELTPEQQKHFEEIFKSRNSSRPGEERRRRGEWPDQKPSRKPESPTNSTQ